MTITCTQKPSGIILQPGILAIQLLLTAVWKEAAGIMKECYLQLLLATISKSAKSGSGLENDETSVNENIWFSIITCGMKKGNRRSGHCTVILLTAICRHHSTDYSRESLNAETEYISEQCSITRIGVEHRPRE
jgi:hypothetical protein